MNWVDWNFNLNELGYSAQMIWVGWGFILNELCFAFSVAYAPFENRAMEIAAARTLQLGEVTELIDIGAQLENKTALKIKEAMQNQQPRYKGAEGVAAFVSEKKISIYGVASETAFRYNKNENIQMEDKHNAQGSGNGNVSVVQTGRRSFEGGVRGRAEEGGGVAPDSGKEFGNSNESPFDDAGRGKEGYYEDREGRRYSGGLEEELSESAIRDEEGKGNLPQGVDCSNADLAQKPKTENT